MAENIYYGEVAVINYRESDIEKKEETPFSVSIFKNYHDKCDVNQINNVGLVVGNHKMETEITEQHFFDQEQEALAFLFAKGFEYKFVQNTYKDSVLIWLTKNFKG